MKLLKYRLEKIKNDEWSFSEIGFSRINLLVGASGTGKTRYINTIVNFLRQITADKIQFPGKWSTEFEIEKTKYSYKLNINIDPTKQNGSFIEFEKLTNLSNGKVIIERDLNGIKYNGEKLPKLNNQITCISLLKEEDEINNVFRNLQLFVSRRFNGNELEKSFSFGSINPELIKKIQKTKDKEDLIKIEMDFHNRMNFLNQIDKPKYIQVCNLIRQAFPFIQDTKIASISSILPGLNLPVDAPAFCIKEENVNKWIPVGDISSGMQKMFLLILDTILLADNGILVIDEYENSLGINAINFLPDLIEEVGENCQFIMTSHHPYIINRINIKSWKVFHRTGMDVDILDGSHLKEKFKSSRQEYFTQLINDKFYRTGIE